MLADTQGNTLSLCHPLAKANGGNSIYLGTHPYESYFESHATQENAFEQMAMIIYFTLTMTSVYVCTVLVKTIIKYVWAKLDT